jgi:hypothetical protein
LPFIIHNLPKKVNLEAPLLIERAPENGNNIEVKNYPELEALFVAQKLHPADLKAAVVSRINQLFESIRAASTKPAGK